jgi:hypothetical protein
LAYLLSQTTKNSLHPAQQVAHQNGEELQCSASSSSANSYVNKKFLISLSFTLLQRLLLHPKAIQLGLQGMLGLLQRLNLLPTLKGLFEKQRVEGLEVLELL